jgi:predicted ATP-dependent Lon-type protease
MLAERGSPMEREMQGFKSTKSAQRFLSATLPSGGTTVAGALNLGGSIEMIPNAVRIAELAIDKQAQTLLMPVSERRQLNDLPDDLSIFGRRSA